jgi:hypothetical protein
MGQFHWNPDTYLELMHSDVPDYLRLQDEVARACAQPSVSVRAMLELGTGTGETARRVLRVQPDAELVGIDAGGVGAPRPRRARRRPGAITLRTPPRSRLDEVQLDGRVEPQRGASCPAPGVHAHGYRPQGTAGLIRTPKLD